jgi:hypothetical protein
MSKCRDLAGELMVAVEGDFFAFDLLIAEHAHAEVGLGVEAHADLRGVGAEGGEGHALDQFVAWHFAVAELRRTKDALRVAGGEAFDALLKAGDDVLPARRWKATSSSGRARPEAFDELALVVLQGVFDGDDGFFSGYAHDVRERRT